MRCQAGRPDMSRPDPKRVLRFRQVHLDFHTAPAIGNVGGKFDRKQWQETLKAGHVNVVNCFAKCHHGWSYHETKAGKRHPHLKIELLREQIAGAREIGVEVQIYVSVGLDNAVSAEHPEWREVDVNGEFTGWAKKPTDAGFHKMCLFGPYLDYVCDQIREVARLFSDGAGFWLDIINQGECCCKWCREGMAKAGLDPARPGDRLAHARAALLRYFREATGACRSVDPAMPVFHNSGHVRRGDREVLEYFSHLELESLPTGGWGYDHFPMSAKYCKNLGFDILGMTGKFHTSWGEFGGFKHPNALKYECAAMLAVGAKCSVGDQLHPEGVMDASTYRLIGEAYAEVEKKEPWCDGVEPVADAGFLSVASLDPLAASHSNEPPSDTGATRMLLEGHVLFDVLDREMDFSRYRVLILPDLVAVDAALKEKIDGFLAAGGRLLLTGESGLAADGSGSVFDTGATYHGISEFTPDYVLPVRELRAGWVDSPLVMYEKSLRMKAADGVSLGDVYDPYFNRTWEHFCSHQHAPARPEPSGFTCGVRKGNVMHLAHPVFKLYAKSGAVACRDYALAALRALLGPPKVEVSLPSTGRATLMWQPEKNRHVLHLLNAVPVKRGAGIEVIEDIAPAVMTRVTLRLGVPVKRATLEPGGVEVPLERDGDAVRVTVERFTGHQMVVLETQEGVRS